MIGCKNEFMLKCKDAKIQGWVTRKEFKNARTQECEAKRMHMKRCDNKSMEG